jgi:hypothetical protein
LFQFASYFTIFSVKIATFSRASRAILKLDLSCEQKLLLQTIFEKEIYATASLPSPLPQNLHPSFSLSSTCIPLITTHHLLLSRSLLRSINPPPPVPFLRPC